MDPGFNPGLSWDDRVLLHFLWARYIFNPWQNSSNNKNQSGRLVLIIAQQMLLNKTITRNVVNKEYNLVQLNMTPILPNIVEYKIKSSKHKRSFRDRFDFIEVSSFVRKENKMAKVHHFVFCYIR